MSGDLYAPGGRIGEEGTSRRADPAKSRSAYTYGNGLSGDGVKPIDAGCWLAEVRHNASDEAEPVFPKRASSVLCPAKAGAADRPGSKQPTVKPVDLMRCPVQSITPLGGPVLDPFAGSKTCLAQGPGRVLGLSDRPSCFSSGVE